jgi:hypothetical protein
VISRAGRPCHFPLLASSKGARLRPIVEEGTHRDAFGSAKVGQSKGHSRMKQVALVSYAGFPELTDDDRLLLPALRHLGLEARCAVWDAPVDWTQFDQVILRSCRDLSLEGQRVSGFGRKDRTIVRAAAKLSRSNPLEHRQTVPATIGRRRVPRFLLPLGHWNCSKSTRSLLILYH